MIPPPPRSTLTDTLLPCPTLFRSPGEVWFIEIRGPNVFKGYWRMPEKPAAEFREGYFVSGDMGRVDQRGYVSIVGREKDLIIAGGFNVYPAEVEDAIGELPVVREVAVIRSEEHTSELQSLMRISYAVFCLKKNTNRRL